MAKGKTAEVGEQRPEVGGQPQPEMVTVWAVERLFVAAENRYVEPGEVVMLPTATAVLLVEIGAAAEAVDVVDEDEGGFVLVPAPGGVGETVTAAAASQ